MTNPYDFQNVVAVKMLIRRGDEVLLVREPEFNDWMPNRLGLPGGKPLVNETLAETVERKISTEVGLRVDIKGIVRIVDIIMPEKTVYHVLLAADYVSGEIGDVKTESDDLAWYGADQLLTLGKNDFTEYYNDDVLKQYLNGELPVFPIDLITTQDNRSDEINAWMEKGSTT